MGSRCWHSSLLYEAYQYLDKVLIPNGWSHPDRYDWSERAHNWSRGVTVSITIPEDEDNVDEIWNAKWGIDPERPCPGNTGETCPTEWDEAAWRFFTGPSVKITVRDND